MIVLTLLAAFARGLLGGYLITGGIVAALDLPGLYRLSRREFTVVVGRERLFFRAPWWWPIAATVRTLVFWPLILTGRWHRS
jgi:hypothetical protein